MRRYKYKRIYTWNSQLAYLAGIIASDGYLSSNGRHINVTSTDLEILENVCSILELKVKIGIKKNGFGGYGNFVQFGDVALYDFLFIAGITPAKSKTIVKVDIPDVFFSDFLRGLFDGDGTVYGYWDPRWPNSLMYYTEFTSASINFLQWLQARNTALIGVSNGKIKTGIRALKLRYAKSDSQKLYKYMYYSNDIPALNRKRIKFKKFLEADPYIKHLPGRVAESVDAPD